MPILAILPPRILHLGKAILKNVFHMPIGQVFRYLTSGFTAAGVNLGVLYGLVEYGGLHYLFASSIALTIAIVVSFSLHKFFTFRERDLSRAHVQFGLYLGVVGIDFCLNLLLMWLSVEFLGIPYLFGAIIAGGAIALINFFAYRLVVFRKH